MSLHELNVFATAARSIDEAVRSVRVESEDAKCALEPLDVGGVDSITLHGNDIQSLAHGLRAPNLTYLNLSSNSISTLDGSLLATLPQLTVLDLSANFISKVEGLAGLTTLTVLRLACNQLASLDWLAAFHSSSHRLQKLDVAGNDVSGETLAAVD